MVRSPHCIFRGVVIEAAARDNFADAKCSIAHDRYGELATRYKALDQDLTAEAPICHFFAPGVVVNPHDTNADARTLVGRLYDKRCGKGIVHGKFLRAGEHAVDDGQTCSAKNLLCSRL